jgi:uncharacterized low-complexity protein
MAEKAYITKPVAAAVGVAFVSSLAVTSTAVASDNPFAAAELDSGYMLAGGHKGKEGKCGEGKCGGEKHEEVKCGEGKCGGEKAEEGKCGEGKCGGDKG